METKRTPPFGKYKGQLIHDIIDSNTSYITWLMDVVNFKFNEDELKHYHERMEALMEKNMRRASHPGGEACCDAWESWAYGGAISPYGSDFI